MREIGRGTCSISLIRGGSLPRSNPTQPPGEGIYFKCVVRGEKVRHKKTLILERPDNLRLKDGTVNSSASSCKKKYIR